VKNKFLSIFLLLALVLWQPTVAQQNSLPACTQDITDTDDDGVPSAVAWQKF